MRTCTVELRPTAKNSGMPALTRRLSGERVWLVKCYAAWCPACKGAMGKFHAVAERLKDAVEVEVGAINCERPENKKIVDSALAGDCLRHVRVLGYPFDGHAEPAGFCLL